MPLPDPAPRALWPDGTELLASAFLSLVVATGLLVPGIVQCGLADFQVRCGHEPPVGWPLWLGQAVWIWCTWLLAHLTNRWLPQAKDQRPMWLGLQIVGVTLLCPVIGALLGQTDGRFVAHNPYDLQVQASFVAVACLAVEYRHRRRRGEADAALLHLNAQSLARQLDQARTALLQAQVEPHFLFNTLAHLRRLAHTDPQSAREMLSDLRRYLAAALPDLRQTETPLARELELVRAFLALHQRRMGTERLRLSFDIAAGLEEAIVPSTCLLTLAENAVKHGVTPQVGGGEIRVSAAPDPELPSQLRLEVADTGAGMGESSGGGTGLVTLRARLAALHGHEAKLSLHLNQPRGLIARVQLPWR